MIEQLEHRILFSYPLGPEWNPAEDNPPGTQIYNWTLGMQSGSLVHPGMNESWSFLPREPIFHDDPTPVLTLTNVPPHSEIKVLAQARDLDAEQPEFDPTTDGAFVTLNNLVTASDNYVEPWAARINTGLQPNGLGSTVTVEVGPHNTEPGEWLSFHNVQVWIWTPTVSLQHPPSLNEGQSGIVRIVRTGGDHGIYPIPVQLAQVAVSQPSPILNPARTDEWTLETNVTIPAGPPGTSVNAAVSIVDDTEVEPEETAVYRVLPSNIHTQGGTTEQPSGNRYLNINTSDYSPYGGGGYGGGYGGGSSQPKGAFSDDAIASEDDDDYVGELVDSVAGDLFGEIVT